MLCLLLIVEYDKKAYHSTPRTYVSLLHAGFVVNLILGCVSSIEKIVWLGFMKIFTNLKGMRVFDSLFSSKVFSDTLCDAKKDRHLKISNVLNKKLQQVTAICYQSCKIMKQ